MKIVKIGLIGLCMLLCSFRIYAQGDGFYLGLSVGKGDVNVDVDSFPGSSIIDDAIQDDVFVGGISLGYEFPSGVFFDVTHDSFDTLAIFFGDILDLDSTRLGVGYVLPSQSNYKFYGMAGLDYWDLNFEESSLFNPGPEFGASDSGSDIYFQVGVDYRFNQRVRLGLSFNHTAADYGSMNALKLNFKFFP